jgi:DNA-3-methyladenine glycosylase II
MTELPSITTAKLSMGPRRYSLPAVAAAYLEHGARWASLPPAQLVTELQTIPRVGPWTAGLAVADHTNDYSLLPFADFAISSWATNFLTTGNQPLEETDFAKMWRRAQGQQLSMLTLLTLAWGIHHADELPLWTTNSQQR